MAVPSNSSRLDYSCRSGCRHGNYVQSTARRMTSSGMLRRVALVKAGVSEELSISIIRVTRISELGKTLAVTSSRRRVTRQFHVPVKAPAVPTVQAAGWTQMQVCTIRKMENSRSYRDSKSDPVRSKSLYRLSYPGHYVMSIW
jgi:hypothetical protein